MWRSKEKQFIPERFIFEIKYSIKKPDTALLVMKKLQCVSGVFYLTV